MALRRILASLSAFLLACCLSACGRETDVGSSREDPHAGSGGGSSQGGASGDGGGSGGGRDPGSSGGRESSAAGGRHPVGDGGTSEGGAGGKGGRGASGAIAGGGASTGGIGSADAAVEAGACVDCFTLYDLHWGMDGGFVAYTDLSRLGPCRAYSHDRTPRSTNPPSLTCTAQIPGCPSRIIDGIERAIGDPELRMALQAHTLYGNDPRPMDGQVFRFGVGNDFIDVGPSCAGPSGCAGMPAAVRAVVGLLHALDDAELAAEPCKSVFGT